jgi:hypothetical protein
VAHAAALAAFDCVARAKPLMWARCQIKSVTSIVILRLAEYPSVRPNRPIVLVQQFASVHSSLVSENGREYPMTIRR